MILSLLKQFHVESPADIHGLQRIKYCTDENVFVTCFNSERKAKGKVAVTTMQVFNINCFPLWFKHLSAKPQRLTVSQLSHAKMSQVYSWSSNICKPTKIDDPWLLTHLSSKRRFQKLSQWRWRFPTATRPRRSSLTNHSTPAGLECWVGVICCTDLQSMLLNGSESTSKSSCHRQQIDWLE